MSSLTKDQLRNELISHGVEPPMVSSKKEELVKLYNKHVLPVQQAAGEFSSDEEFAGNQTNGDEHAMPVLTDDLSGLSNNEILTKLKEYGVETGPVVGSTRRVYERKLARLMEGGGVDDVAIECAAPATNGTGDNGISDNGTNGNGVDGADRYSSDSESEEQPPPRAPTPPLRRTSPRQSVPVTAGSSTAEVRRRTTVSTHTVTDSAAVKAVYLTSANDQPSPRRSVRDMRGLHHYESAGHVSPVVGTSSVDGRVRLTAGPGTGHRSWPHRLVHLIVILLLITAVYYLYQYNRDTPTFRSVVRAARDAMNRVMPPDNKPAAGQKL